MASAARGVGLALGAAGVSCAVAYAGTQLLISPPAPRQCPSERCRRDTFEQLAPKWDATVRSDEFLAGISRWRRRLLQHASGDVLEVAVGSGRNFSYYGKAKVQSVTCIDFSRAMLEIADSKRAELAPIPLRLKLATSQKMDFQDCSFDTVVDTFGVCSFEEPLESLREMRRVVKEDGQVLLLEHGASSWELVQGLLNRSSQRHVEKFGCYPNRNIVGLVQAAGLHIVTDERKHFGTTYLLICKRAPPPQEPNDK
uniref:Methyltransferase type 11 domain-containing protein n=1 Tax=Pyrodinium bahamense TaxID=73915 RepID=A0A7S0AWC0_9DINO